MRNGAVVLNLDGMLVDSTHTVVSVIKAVHADQRLPPLDIATFRNSVSLGADELLRHGLDCPGRTGL